MSAQPEVSTARYEVRYPHVGGYRKLSEEQVNEFGDLLEGIKEEVEPSAWFDELIRRAKPKRSVAHRFIPWDAEAALASAQRSAARLAFSQFVPIADAEDNGPFGPRPAPPAVISLRMVVEGDDGKPEATFGPADWRELQGSEEGRQAAIRKAVERIWGLRSWIMEFEELEDLYEAILKAAKDWGVA